MTAVAEEPTLTVVRCPTCTRLRTLRAAVQHKDYPLADDGIGERQCRRCAKASPPEPKEPPTVTSGCRCGRRWLDAGICVNCGHGVPEILVNGLEGIEAAPRKQIVRRRLLASRTRHPTRRDVLAAVLGRHPDAIPIQVLAQEYRDGHLYPPHNPTTPIDQIGVPVWLVLLDR